jgi:hypothetical protein
MLLRAAGKRGRKKSGESSVDANVGLLNHPNGCHYRSNGVKLVPYSFSLFIEERDTFSSRSSSAYDNGTSHRMQLGGNGLVKKKTIFSFVSSFIVQVCRSFISHDRL